MRIVILDGHTLNPGDLSWGPVEKLGDTSIFPRTSPGEVAERISNAEIVLTNKVPLSREVIGGAQTLRYIGVTATGYNIVDVDAARERDIVVTNVPAYGTHSVAQHTFALLFELANSTGLHDESVKKGDWTNQPDFCYWKKPLAELHGLTMGIVGLGQIGSAVATIALAMGMKVQAVHKHPERDKMEGVAFTDMETCFRTSDVVSLHCSLNKDNEEFVNRELLSLMKPTAFFLNVSRGGLVKENDLAHALHEGVIAGAGLDVLSIEPPPADNPLLHAPNCIITPHQAWATQAARRRLLQTAADNIAAFQAGRPVNRV
ncbi:MAG: D-2-hydroxyacid dehydrogenase [Cyclobacteriaceae bacterium]|jgi:glycerate dehydrogenase|nr:D-2-hydroxyacid dehydrogenase [Cyclobacteriaceae bacterium]